MYTSPYAVRKRKWKIYKSQILPRRVGSGLYTIETKKNEKNLQVRLG